MGSPFGDATDGQYHALVHRDDLWYGSSYWTGPDWTRVGKDWHHPGENTPSVRRFAAPRDGRVTIGGRVRKAHLDGDGVRVWIAHGAKTVWQAELDGKDARGVDPNLTLEVRRGDAIRFVVHKRGTIFCDTTWWDPVVTYADGPRFPCFPGILHQNARRQRLVVRDGRRAGERRRPAAGFGTDPEPGALRRDDRGRPDD